jgi:ribonuclease HI
MTNNQAEYRTVIEALRHLATLLGDRASSETVRIEGDSQLVLSQLKGTWKVRNPGLRLLHQEALELLQTFGKVEYSWHPRMRSVKILGH